MAEIEKLDIQSMNIKQEQTEKLKILFPEIFTEGNKIDWERLKLTLGEDIDTGKERYGLNWPGKADCYKTIQQSSIATLIPVREESVDFDITENLFIEGDNLEVLKLLQKSYLGKVKMFYFDPPYNTGSDFIYPDNYSDNLQTYLEYTGQVDNEGRRFGTNTDTDGRFHSKWMNMMYPRLFLAKNLLKEDGVIFISIDDNEVINLRALCNELFGEENFIEQLIWKCRAGGGADSKFFSNDHEYILCYAKNINALNRFYTDYSEEQLKKFQYEDDKGKYFIKTLEMPEALGKRPNLQYPITAPDGSFIQRKREGNNYTWVLSEPEFLKYKEKGLIEFKKTNEKWMVYRKYHIDKEDGEIRQTKPRSILDKIALTANGSKELKLLFDSDNENKLFDNPKPVNLIKFLLKIITEENDIVLDFFAGSCTTAHAVLDLNKEDGGNRKFICVQLPQPNDELSEASKAGYKTIADIGKERIRRVIKSIKEPKENPKSKKTEIKQATLGLDLGENSIGWVKVDKGSIELTESSTPSLDLESLDLGFKVFKLAPSNFKIWNSNIEKTTEAVQLAMQMHTEHINEQATQEALLYEILLKSGFELVTPIEKLSIEGMAVYSVSEGQLLICLEKKITYDLIKAIAESQPVRVVCLDEGFRNNDQLKTNAVQIMKSIGVVKFQTV